MSAFENCEIFSTNYFSYVIIFVSTYYFSYVINKNLRFTTKKFKRLLKKKKLDLHDKKKTNEKLKIIYNKPKKTYKLVKCQK